MDSPPDLRFVQANERTLLAWIRTSLALMAFGFVVARIGIWLQVQMPERSANWPRALWVGAAFVLLGMGISVGATVRYVRVRRALVEGRIIVPGHALALFAASSLILLGGMLVAYIFML